MFIQTSLSQGKADTLKSVMDRLYVLGKRNPCCNNMQTNRLILNDKTEFRVMTDPNIGMVPSNRAGNEVGGAADLKVPSHGRPLDSDDERAVRHRVSPESRSSSAPSV